MRKRVWLSKLCNTLQGGWGRAIIFNHIKVRDLYMYMNVIYEASLGALF